MDVSDFIEHLDKTLDPFLRKTIGLRLFTKTLFPAPVDFDPFFGVKGNASRAYNGNCYAYGLNIEMSRWPTPGALNSFVCKKLPAEECTPEAIHSRLIQDGLQRIFEHGANPETAQIMAAFVALPEHQGEGADYHFFRMHRDRSWSHKMAWDLPTLMDSSGKTIDNVLNADRGKFTEFVGFYEVPPEGVDYKI